VKLLRQYAIDVFSKRQSYLQFVTVCYISFWSVDMENMLVLVTLTSSSIRAMSNFQSIGLKPTMSDAWTIVMFGCGIPGLYHDVWQWVYIPELLWCLAVNDLDYHDVGSDGCMKTWTICQHHVVATWLSSKFTVVLCIDAKNVDSINKNVKNAVFMKIKSFKTFNKNVRIVMSEIIAKCRTCVLMSRILLFIIVYSLHSAKAASLY